MTPSPKVSVVMPVHDGEPFLRDAVESVLTQTLGDLELVCIDDGSADGTPEILAEYARSDRRVVVERTPAFGGTFARTRGYSRARAPVVANMDADDVALPTRLAVQHAFLAAHASVAVVGGAVVFIDAVGTPFGSWQYPLTDGEIRAALEHSSPFVHPATTVRKDAVARVGGYRLSTPAQDLDLWLRLAEGHVLANVAEPVLQYRVHPAQTTVTSCEQQALAALAARLAARARAAGCPDPLRPDVPLDRALLERLGADESAIADAIVDQLTWTARLTGRAGYDATSQQLFAAALARARSARLPRRAADIHGERARLHRERGRRGRAVIEVARAKLAGIR